MLTVMDKGILNKVVINKINHKSENSSIQFLGNNNKVIIESRCSFKGFRLIISGNNNVVTIKRGTLFLGGVISLASSSELLIGERCSFGARLEIIIDSAKVSFGNDCMSIAGLTIRTTDIHGIYDLKTGKIINQPRDIGIGDYVWLGKDVSVQKGAMIAPCNIITMGAVFTCISEPFEIWGGVPAVKLREGAMWAKSGRLENILDDKYAKMYIEKYSEYCKNNLPNTKINQVEE